MIPSNRRGSTQLIRDDTMICPRKPNSITKLLAIRSGRLRLKILWKGPREADLAALSDCVNFDEVSGAARSASRGRQNVVSLRV